MILLFIAWLFQLGTNLRVWQIQWFMYKGSSIQWLKNKQSSSLLSWSQAVTRSGNSGQVNKSKLSLMMKWHLDHGQVMEISSTRMPHTKTSYSDWIRQCVDCWTKQLLTNLNSIMWIHNICQSKFWPHFRAHTTNTLLLNFYQHCNYSCK